MPMRPVASSWPFHFPSNIQTVGRLVKKQHVGALNGKQSENDTTLLTFRQSTHQGSLGITTETVLAELLTPVLVVLRLGAVLVTDEVESRLCQVKLLSTVLGVETELQVGVSGDNTTSRGKLAGHETEQSRLADTVGSDKGSSGVHIETEVKVAVQVILGVARVGEGNVVKRQDGRRELVNIGKTEREDTVLLDGLDETIGLHLVKNLLSGLGLSHQVGVGTSASNELLDVDNFILLLLVGLHLVGLVLGSRLAVRVVVTTVVDELLAAHVDHAGADTVEEIHRVGDENQGSLPLLEVLLEPHTSLQIQMGSGVIEKQNGGLDEEGLGKGDSHTPTTGHELLSLVVETLKLQLSLSDNPLKGTQVTGRSTLVKKVDVEMLGDGVLASSDGLEESGLSATVLAEETVSSTVRELESGIGDEDSAVEDQGSTCDLDILAGLGRSEDTGGDTVRDTVLIHLVGKTLHLVELIA
ncbi:hypothetical protein HG531_009852 [Fusarium graminearum]|nr:hypothetical protein HG531_009852 [Fusarium graminearum]